MLEIKRKSECDGFVFTAADNGETIAELSSRLEADTVYIEKFSGEPFLFDAMFRALINSAEHNGAVSVKSDETLSELLKTNSLPIEISSINAFFEQRHCDGNCAECNGKCE